MDAEISTPPPVADRPWCALKMRNLLTSAVLDKTFKADEKFKEPDLQLVPVSFLCSGGDGSYFLDQESFETLTLPAEVVGNALAVLVVQCSTRTSTKGIRLVCSCRCLSIWRLPKRNSLYVGIRRADSTKMAKLETGLRSVFRSLSSG
jgi:hypothetical protein